MQHHEWEKVKQVFTAALERPVAMRAQFLTESCGEDEALHDEVESLLAAHEEPENLLERHALDLAEQIQPAGGKYLGKRFGAYRILREIGRGGMGSVFLAERADGEFQQHVALKIIRQSFAHGDLEKLFRRERQIHASLNHPNIAKLVDGGVSDTGEPFLAMEFIAGDPLIVFAEKHQLSIEDRLRLFLKVCRAVSFAHQNLIIHRDLKPSNILVPDDGEPRLLDFGLAKLSEPAAASDSLTNADRTETAFRAFTAAYAAPEQILGKNVTTVSDIFSLGVILYELLAGEKPFNFDGKDLEEIINTATGDEPALPSRIVKSDSPQSAIRQRRLRGDLDNITMKALQKDPARRYQSVLEFAADIEKHLGNLPISARPNTLPYRASRFYQRNKIAVSATAFIILALLAGLATSLRQYRNALRENVKARHEKLKAERINGFLQRMLSFSNQSISSVSPVAHNKDVSVNEMLDQIAPQIEAELADQPEVRAQLLRTVGSAYASLGQYDVAEKNLRAGLVTQIHLYGEDNPEVAATMDELGVLLFRELKYEEAQNLLEKAADFYRRQQKSNAPDYSPAKLALTLDYLGDTTYFRGDTKTARLLLQEAVGISSGANLKGGERGVLALNKSDLGSLLVLQGDVEPGEALLLEAVTEFRQISNPVRWELGATLQFLGFVATNKNRLDEAEKYLLESEQILRKTLGEKNNYLCGAIMQQANVLLRKNNPVAAEKKARESLAMIKAFSPDNKLPWVRVLLVLGDISVKVGHAPEGVDYFRQALAIYEQQSPKNFLAIAPLKVKLSQLLVSRHHLSEAEHIALQAQEEVRQNLGEQHPLMKTTAHNLIQIYEKRGKFDLAEKLK
jgi:serine/threonine-protein kinase